MTDDELQTVELTHEEWVKVLDVLSFYRLAHLEPGDDVPRIESSIDDQIY